MKRRLLSLLLALAMVLALPAFAAAAEPTYSDTAGHWAESSIERWSGHGIVQGSDGAFDPDGQLTCAQLAAILARLLKLPEAPDAGFSDNAADKWYYDSINRCAAAGILLGNGDGTVTPEGPISRERAMVMLARVLGVEPIEDPDLTKFGDAAEVSDYAQGYVAALIEAGIVNGVGDDQIGPQLDISRAATVAILDRAIGTYADKDGETVEVGDGLTLIVAKDVKIENAPAGSRILVADGADGLTVNGKSVTDDQTYVVPEKKPETPVHTHSYDEYNYCAGCGQFKSTVVAAIGQKGYETLAEAVAAAQDGDTVKLTASGNGNGVIVETNRFTDKGLTVDFSGYTYTVGGQLVGSSGTGTNAFQLKAGNKITFKNGNIVGATEGSKPADDTPDWHGAPAIVIQNYCDLTLDQMVVTGGDETVYTMSNNCGNVVIKDSTINIGGAKGYSHGPFAFDVYGGFKSYSDVTVTVEGSSIINGKIEVTRVKETQNKNKNSLIITGGIFTDTLSVTDNEKTRVSISGGMFKQDVTPYCAAGFVTETSDGSGIWTVTEDRTKTFTVQVGSGKYETLADAVAAVEDGDTVTLLDNVTLTESLAVNAAITLDLNEKVLTSTWAMPDKAAGAERYALVNNAALTIKNGTFNAGEARAIGAYDALTLDNVTVTQELTGGHACVAACAEGKTYTVRNSTIKGAYSFSSFANNAVIKIENSTLIGTGNVLYHNGTNHGLDLTVTDTKITGDGCGVYISGSTVTQSKGGLQKAVFKNCTITGVNGVEVKFTDLTLENCQLKATGTPSFKQNNDGPATTGFALVATDNTMTPEEPAPQGKITVLGENGKFEGLVGLRSFAGVLTQYPDMKETTYAISGGTFSSDPSAYVAAGYKADKSGDTWTVEKSSESNP